MKGSLGQNFCNIPLSPRQSKREGIVKFVLNFTILGLLVSTTIKASNKRWRFLKSRISSKSRKVPRMRSRTCSSKLTLTFPSLISKTTQTCHRSLKSPQEFLTRLGKDTRSSLLTLLEHRLSVQTLSSLRG